MMPTLQESDRPTTTQLVERALHHAVLLDRSTHPRIEITGADRVDLLHRLSTNDLLAAGVHQTIHTSFVNEKGRLVDYVSLLLRDSSVLALVSPGNEEGFMTWIAKYTIMEDVQLRSRTGDLMCYSIFGPFAPTILLQLFPSIPDAGHFLDLGTPDSPMTISRRSDFGLEWFDLIVNKKDGNNLLERLKHAGSALPLINDVAFQTYRILSGIPAFGHEIALAFNPFEAGLDHSISRRKGCYIGQEVIARLETYNKVQRNLMGIVFPDPPSLSGIPTLLYSALTEVGTLTSITTVPLNGYFCSFGIVKKAMVKKHDLLRAGDPHAGPVGVAVDIPMTLKTLGQVADLCRTLPTSRQE